MQSSLSCSYKVTVRIIKNIFIASTAYKQIQSLVQNAGNLHEIGGVLLGRKLHNSYYIDAITASTNDSPELTTFILDGVIHSKMAQDIIEKSINKAELIGVWHSHICDFGSFSAQDKLSNKTISSMLGGALSIIATMHNSKNVALHTYYITKDNCEHYQKIKIEGEKI